MWCFSGTFLIYILFGTVYMLRLRLHVCVDEIVLTRVFCLSAPSEKDKPWGLRQSLTVGFSQLTKNEAGQG